MVGLDLIRPTGHGVDIATKHSDYLARCACSRKRFNRYPFGLGTYRAFLSPAKKSAAKETRLFKLNPLKGTKSEGLRRNNISGGVINDHKIATLVIDD